MILIIAEKPSVGRAIASVVGATQWHDGYVQGNGYIVSWCLGHLVSLKFPDDYNNGWQEKWSFAQLPMIPTEWQFKITEKTKEQYDILNKLIHNHDITEVICATDADREGECIFRYVRMMTKCYHSVRRLWVSSLEESAIRLALNRRKPLSEYNELFQAGFCRARADWLVGLNGSRLFSCRYRGQLNIGRVQTPTLAMIVQRDYGVSHFVKQKYFTVDLVCDETVFSSERIDDEATADKIISECGDGTAVIKSVKREIRTSNAPKLYDLTTLQREANKIHGYTAQQLSQEKTLITHGQKKAHFLGYSIYVRKSNLPKKDKLGRMVRNYGGRVVLEVDSSTIRDKLLSLKAMEITYVDGKEIWKPKARYSMKDGDDFEILRTYNSEIRGFYHYYSIANNSSIINS